MQVCVPSTPAQMFHMLRRQMLRSFRKPLIVMTPKSLLRHKQSVSPLTSLSDGKFETILEDSDAIDPARARRVVFCSGKVYYDLLAGREENGIDDIAIVRIEQLYPFPIERFASVVASYPAAKDIVWCQEEPQNQGAWYQIRHRLQEPLTDGRPFVLRGAPGRGRSRHRCLQSARRTTARAGGCRAWLIDGRLKRSAVS